MKLPCLIILTITALFISKAFGNDIQLDNRFFTVMNSALDIPYPRNIQRWMAMSLGEKKTNAQALYLLDVKASETEGISNAVRLAVAASAIQTFGNYISVIPLTSHDFEDFTASSDLSAALFLLDDSQKLLDRIPPREAYLNVGGPGVAASGMDPSGVKDPKNRADYERRIAENNQATEENNNRHRISVGIVSVKSSLHRNIPYLAREGKVGSYTNTIGASSLPAAVKAELLEGVIPNP